MTARDARFEALVNACAVDLYRYACWLCGSSTVAEDLVQETFLRAWKGLDGLKEHRLAKSWLITILRRENARRFERRQPLSRTTDAVELETLPDPGPRSVDRMILRRALESLPPEYREPLVLQVLGGFSGEEIARILDLKPGTVMVRLFRARQKLRKWAAEDRTEPVAGETL